MNLEGIDLSECRQPMKLPDLAGHQNLDGLSIRLYKFECCLSGCGYTCYFDTGWVQKIEGP